MTKQDKKTSVEIEELTQNWKRALADYQNLEKRHEREKAEFVEYANSGLILKLVGVLDHLKKAQEQLKDSGLDLAIKEFDRVLAEEGLTEIEALGKEFNPLEMEAVEIVAGEKNNQIAEVINKGYSLKGRVIRPARVKVFKTACAEATAVKEGGK